MVEVHLVPTLSYRVGEVLRLRTHHDLVDLELACVTAADGKVRVLAGAEAPVERRMSTDTVRVMSWRSTYSDTALATLTVMMSTYKVLKTGPWLQDLQARCRK